MFFRNMEENILKSLRRGELIPGIPRNETDKQGPPKEPRAAPSAPIVRIRTISAMDEHMLAQVNQAPSSISTLTSKPARIVRTSSVDGRPPLPIRKSKDDESASSDSNLAAATTSTAIVVNAATKPQASEPLEETRDEKTIVSSSRNSTMSHIRRNTGGTIYVKNTMDNPDIQATIKCVCAVYRSHIVESVKRKPVRSPVSVQSVPHDVEVFSDDYQTYSRRRSDLDVPLLIEIEAFYDEFFKRSQLEHDTIIMSLIYVERLIKETNGVLTPTPDNWRSILCSCMILASKVWDDLSMWNIDFSNVSAASGLSLFSLQRINQLEIALLTSLNFRVEVAASEYAKYYFLIRTMLIRSGMLDHDPSLLSSQEAQKLENRTQHYQDDKLKSRREYNRSRRHKSVDWSAIGNHVNQPKVTGPVLKDSVCLEQLSN
jgi:Cyclin, N-terminal domain